MKFMQTYTIPSDKEKRNEAIARFQKTGGQPPQGAKLLGRWTSADFSGGYALLDSENPQALTEFALMWSDVLELTIVPVLEDQEVSEVLKRAGK